MFILNDIFYLYNRFCSFEGANENVWHVLDVQGNSPASLAGLKSDTDYIIGADSILHEVIFSPACVITCDLISYCITLCLAMCQQLCVRVWNNHNHSIEKA